MVLSFNDYLLQSAGGYGPAPTPRPLTPEEEMALQQEAYYSSGGGGVPSGPEAPVYIAPPPQQAPPPDYSSPSPQVQYDQQYVAAEQGIAPQGQPVPATPPSEYYDRGLGGDPQPAPQPYQSPSPQINDNQYAQPPSEFYDRGTGSVQNEESAPAPVIREDKYLSTRYPGGYGPADLAVLGGAVAREKNKAAYQQGEALSEQVQGASPRGEGRRETQLATNPDGRSRFTPAPPLPQQSLNQLEDVYGSLESAYEQTVAGPARYKASLRDESFEEVPNDQRGPSLKPATFDTPRDDAPLPRFAGERYEDQYGERDRLAMQFFGKRYVQLSENERRIVSDSLRGAMAPDLPDLPGAEDLTSDRSRKEAMADREAATSREDGSFGFGTYDPADLNAQKDEIWRVKAQNAGGSGLRATPGGLIEVPVDLPGVTLSPENFTLYKLATDEANRRFYSTDEPVYVLKGNPIKQALANLGDAQSKLLNEQFTAWLRSEEGKTALRDRYTPGSADANGLVNDWTESMGFWESMWQISLLDPTIGLEAIGGALGIGGRALTQLGVRAAARGVRGATQLQTAGKLVEKVGKGTELLADPLFNGGGAVMNVINPPTEAALAKRAEESARRAAESLLDNQPLPGRGAPPSGGNPVPPTTNPVNPVNQQQPTGNANPPQANPVNPVNQQQPTGNANPATNQASQATRPAFVEGTQTDVGTGTANVEDLGNGRFKATRPDGSFYEGTQSDVDAWVAAMNDIDYQTPFSQAMQSSRTNNGRPFDAGIATDSGAPVLVSNNPSNNVIHLTIGDYYVEVFDGNDYVEFYKIRSIDTDEVVATGQSLPHVLVGPIDEGTVRHLDEVNRTRGQVQSQTNPVQQQPTGNANPPQTNPAPAARSARDTTPTLPTRPADQFPYLEVRPGTIGSSYPTEADVDFGLLDRTARGEGRWRVGDVSANGIYRIDEQKMPDGTSRFYLLGNVRPEDAGVASNSRVFVDFGFETTMEDAVESARWMVITRQNDPNGAAWTPASIEAQRRELSRRGNLRRGGATQPAAAAPPAAAVTSPVDPPAAADPPAAPARATPPTSVDRRAADDLDTLIGMDDADYNGAPGKSIRRRLYQRGILADDRSTNGRGIVNRHWLEDQRAARPGADPAASAPIESPSAPAAPADPGYVPDATTDTIADFVYTRGGDLRAGYDDSDMNLIQLWATHRHGAVTDMDAVRRLIDAGEIEPGLIDQFRKLISRRQTWLNSRPKVRKFVFDERTKRGLDATGVEESVRGAGEVAPAAPARPGVRLATPDEMVANGVMRTELETAVVDVGGAPYFIQLERNGTYSVFKDGEHKFAGDDGYVGTIDEAIRAAEADAASASAAAAAPAAAPVINIGKDGAGWVPDQSNIDYKGFTRTMRPSEFLSLARDGDRYLSGELNDSVDYLTELIQRGETIANPWVDVEWDEANRVWKTRQHEGRNRMAAVNNLDPNLPVEVHFFPRNGLRARNITDEMRNAPVVSEDGSRTLFDRAPAAAAAPSAAPSSPPANGLPPLDSDRVRSRQRTNMLSDFAPSMYRETSMEYLINDFLPTTRAARDMAMDDVFLANSPALALGQGTNRGVLVEFDANLLKGSLNRNKPMWEAAYQNGEAEFIARFNDQKNYQEAVKSFTIKSDAQTNAVDRIKWQRADRELTEQGWTKADNPDGSVTWTRPAAAPAAALQPTAINKQTVSLTDLTIDEGRFQPGDGTTKRRVQDSEMYRNMVANWNEAEFQRSPTIQAWPDPADGRLYVIGGQHRVSAMKQLFPDRPVEVEIRRDLLTEADARAAARVDNNKGRAETTLQKAEGLNDIIQGQLAARGLTEQTATAEQYDEILKAIPYGDDDKAKLAAIGRLPNLARSLLNAGDKQMASSVQRAAAKFGDLIGPATGTARGRQVISRGEAEALWDALNKQIQNDVIRKKRTDPRISASDIDNLTATVNKMYFDKPVNQTALFDTGSLSTTIDGDVAARIIAGSRDISEATKKADAKIKEAKATERALGTAAQQLARNDPARFPDPRVLTPQRLVTLDINGDPSLTPGMKELAQAFRRASDERVAAEDELAAIIERVKNGGETPRTGPADGQGALFFRSPDPRVKAQALDKKITEIRAANGSKPVMPSTAPGEEFFPVFPPGSWSAKTGAILTNEEEGELTKMVFLPGGQRKEVGNLALDYQSQLQQARALARKPNRTAAEQKTVNRAIKRFYLDAGAEANGYANGMDFLVSSNDRLLNRVVAERISVDVGISRGARKADGSMNRTNIIGQFRDPLSFKVFGQKITPLQAVDTYLNTRRAVALYSPVRGPAYILTQVFGNAVTLGVARPSALNDFLSSPVDWRRIRQRMDNASVESRVDILRRQAGLPKTASLHGANARDELGGGLGKAAKVMTFGAGERVRKLANVADVELRESLWNDVWMREIGTSSIAFQDHVTDLYKRADDRVRAAGGTAFPFNPEAVKAKMGSLRGPRGNDTFSANDVRNALDSLYDDALNANALATTPIVPLPPRGAWSNFADRAGRDWKETLSALDKKALAEVNRVAFSFEDRVGDSIARRFFMFHYWTTRAAALYVQEAIKKPALAAAYYRMVEGFERENEENRGPGWMTGFIKFLGTPAGYSAFYNPLSLLQTAATFQGMEGADNDDGLTFIGKVMQNRIGDITMPNPAVMELLIAAGLAGPLAKTPDVVGDASLVNLVEKGINGFLERSDPNREPVFLPDTRDFINWLNRQSTGALEDAGAPVDRSAYKGPDNFKRTQYESLLRDVLAEENPPDGAEFGEWMGENYPNVEPGTPDSEPLFEEYLSNLRAALEPNADQLGEAFRRFNDMQNASPLSNLPGPLGTIAGALGRQWSPIQMIGSVDSQTDRSADKREGKDAAGEPITEQRDTAINIANDAVGLRDDAARDRNVTSDYWGNPPDSTFTPEERTARNSYLAIKYGNVKGGMILVDGRLVDALTINAMDEEQRADMATAWMDTTLGPKGWEAFESYYAKQDKWYKDTPEAAAMAELEARSKEYPAGERQFIKNVMDNNPGFADYMDGQLERAGNDGWKFAFSKDAWEALTGNQGSIYDEQAGVTEFGIRVPNKDGTIQQVDLAAANAARRKVEADARAEKDADSFGASVQADFDTLDTIKRDLDAYDPSGGAWQAYLANATLPKGATRPGLPSGIYGIVKGSFQGKDGKTYDYPMQGGAAAGYLSYASGVPSGQLVQTYDVWQKSQQREKAKVEAANPEAAAAEPQGPVEPASLVGREADPNLFPDTMPRVPKSAPSGGRTVTPNVDNLNFRAGPGQGESVLRLLPAGMPLTEIGRQGDWVRVRLPDGTEGWVSAAYLNAA